MESLFIENYNQIKIKKAENFAKKVGILVRKVLTKWVNYVHNGKQWEKVVKGGVIMVIDCIQFRVANSRLFSFLKENSRTNLELQLIRFWARHPRARLSLYTIASAMDTAKINLREAIKSLIEKGILQEQEDDNGLITYSLATNPHTQEYIEELAKLDWNEIRILEKQLEGEVVLV
jgi:predicted DNA-binding transcriptional regulator